MSADTAPSAPDSEARQSAVSVIVRWFTVLLCIVFGLVLLFILGGVLYAFRFWAMNNAAAKEVEEEVARLRQSGQPMTAEDLYRFHAIPENVADNSAIWLAAQQSCNPTKLYAAGKGLPFIGDGDVKLLRPEADNSQLTEAEKLLEDFAPALKAILTAAQTPGECRYPVKFEDGVSLVANDVQGVRTIARLLALHIRVKAARGEIDEALTSLSAMFAASDTVSHQLTMVEHLVRLATLGMAMEQTGFLLNEVELTDEQLVQLSRQLEACDLQGGFTRSLIGERAISNLTFDQMGSPFISADRLKCLEIMAQVIAVSQQAPPADRQELQALNAKFEAESRAAAASGSMRQYPLTAALLPPFETEFNARARDLAVRESLLTAIAAERYRQKSGHFPAQLADLVPDYLASVPLDPFDGQPLRFRRRDNTILIYSIGKDGKDDGGQNPPGDSAEPDVVLRLSPVNDHP